MTTPRDPDRLIRAFLMEGAEQLPDQVYDAVRADIERKRQRVVLGPWRMPTLNKLMPIGLGAAAVAVALLVGSRLLLSTPAGPGALASPTPSASTSQPSPARASGSASPTGSFLLWSGRLRVTVTIPHTGWGGEGANGILLNNDNADPPDGAGMIVFVDEPLLVPADPCGWSTTWPGAASTTVDDFVAALARQASRTPSAISGVTIDGHAGKAITLHVPDDANFNRCDGGKFCSWGNPQTAPQDACFRYHQGRGQIDTVVAVDVDGKLVVVDSAVYAGTPAPTVTELQRIVDSMTFG